MISGRALPRLSTTIVPGLRRLTLLKYFRTKIVPGSEGFTLVEIIVAIAILALSAGVVFGVTSDGIRYTRRARTLADATLLAQSLIAKVGTEIPLHEEETDGRANPELRWRLRMERYGDDADREQWPVAAYKVIAEVAWGTPSNSQSIKLITMRLGPKERER